MQICVDQIPFKEGLLPRCRGTVSGQSRCQLLEDPLELQGANFLKAILFPRKFVPVTKLGSGQREAELFGLNMGHSDKFFMRLADSL